MKLLLVAGSLALALLLMPTASAAPTLKVTVTSDSESILIDPGDRAVIALNVTLEFQDYPCSPGTEAGIDLVPPVAPPSWFGAEPHPDYDTYKAPKETKPVSLTIVVSEDAPGDASGAYRLQPVLHFPSQAACGNVDPQADAPEFSIMVRTPPRQDSPTPGTTDVANGTPGPAVGSLVLICCLGAWLFRRRRL